MTKREHLAEELVSVEADYIHSLSELLDMKTQAQKLNVCSPDDINVMFPNFDELHRLHTEFHRQIEQEVKKLKIDENHLIGDVIREFGWAISDNFLYGNLKLCFKFETKMQVKK